MNLNTVFDNIGGTTFKPHPKAKFNLHTAKNRFTLYAGVDGNLQNNTISKIAEENRWVNPSLKVHPTNHLNIFYGGIKGKISTPLAFDLGVKYSKTEDQYFFTTMVENKSGIPVPALKDLTYNNAFEVVYDNLNTVDFSGDLTYTTSNLYLLLSGHFYNYQLTSLEKAPYMPDFTLNATANFRINEKISASSEFFLTGPRNIQLKFFLPMVSSAVPPPPIYLQTDALVDVNIGAKYQFTNKLDFFGRVENLLNNKEEVWYGYAVQGIRFKLGASFSF
jgi:outer membrane receptor protein involved in Fe transport